AELVCDDLRLHRHVLPGAALLHQLVPFRLAALRLFEPAAVGFALKERDQPAQYAARVADEAHLYRIAQPDAQRIDVDLHRARLARLRIVLDIGEAAADDQKRVAGFERLLRRPGAEQAAAAGRVGAVVGHAGFAEQRLDDRRAEQLDHFLQLGAGADRAAAGEDYRLLAHIQQIGGAAQRV